MKVDQSQRRNSPPRFVDLLKGDDFRCALLGSLGFSTRLIMRHASLTPSQIAYRIRKGEILRADYRNGDSAVAESMLRRSRAVAIPAVKAHLHQVSKAENKSYFWLSLIS